MKNQLKNLKEIFFTFLPIIILIFVILDILLFKEFNMEIGYFLTIISNLNFSILNYIFILLLIPFSFMIMIFIILKLSFFFTDKLQEVIKKFKHKINQVFILGFLFIFIYIILLFVFTNIVVSIYENNPLVFIYLFIFILIVCLFLNIVYSLAYKLILIHTNGSAVFIFSQILLILVLIFLNSYDFNEINNAFKLFLFSCVFHIITLIIYSDSKRQVNIKSYSPAYQSIISTSIFEEKKGFSSKEKIVNSYTIFLGFIVSFIIYSHVEINDNSWKKAISSKENTTNDLTFNLIFNRGMLVNGINKLSIIVPDYYHHQVKDLYFYKNDCKSLEIGLESKYLEFGNNLKMYFKNKERGSNVTEVFVILIEEKKYANKKGSEYTLLSLSSYNIP